MLEPHMRTTDASDVELVRPPDLLGGEPPPTRAALWWIAAAVLAVATAVGIYLATARRTAPPAATMADRATPNTASDRPLGYNADRIDLPPLDQTDPLVRNLVKQISSHPSVAAWLTSDRLIRNFVAVVANVAEGPTPAVHLRVVRHAAGFKVSDRGGRTVIDPRSYERYDAIAAAAASIDPAGAARLYATLKPRLEEAHGDLGSNIPLDRTLEQAIVALLKTPVVADPIGVRPEGGTGYAFTDPALEALTPAQKQLLRTGSANVQTIQASLRSIALALGITPERLPSSSAR
jgi:hypothetical protein